MPGKGIDVKQTAKFIANYSGVPAAIIGVLAGVATFALEYAGFAAGFPPRVFQLMIAAPAILIGLLIVLHRESIILLTPVSIMVIYGWLVHGVTYGVLSVIASVALGRAYAFDITSTFVTWVLAGTVISILGKLATRQLGVEKWHDIRKLVMEDSIFTSPERK
jgi:hypothetical protein